MSDKATKENGKKTISVNWAEARVWTCPECKLTHTSVPASRSRKARCVYCGKEFNWGRKVDKDKT